MIEVNKELKLNNLLSYRRKMTMAEIQNEMKNIDAFLKDKKITKNGPVVTTTFAAEIENGEQLIDMEILLPISEPQKVEEPYRLKSELFITNAVYMKHIGDPNQIINTYNTMNSFITGNNLQPLTTGYNISIKDQTQCKTIEDMEIDVYIGMNPNIL